MTNTTYASPRVSSPIQHHSAGAIKRSLTGLAATALIGGLLGLAPTSAQADVDDVARPIDGWTSVDLAVGISKTQTMSLGVATLEEAEITRATATIKDPRGTKKVTLKKISSEDGVDFWEGRLKVSPKSLTNSDAGVWPITYKVTGGATDSQTTDGLVRRASRLTFNAGPEPVRNGKITYAGKLERASWTSKKYYGISRKLEIVRTVPDNEEPSVVATPTTKSTGAYRITRTFPGAGRYWADYRGSSTTHGSSAPADNVR